MQTNAFYDPRQRVGRQSTIGWDARIVNIAATEYQNVYFLFCYFVVLWFESWVFSFQFVN